MINSACLFLRVTSGPSNTSSLLLAQAPGISEAASHPVSENQASARRSAPPPPQQRFSMVSEATSNDSEEYLSFESDGDLAESQSPEDAAARKAEAEARTLERERVLEAAGLIIKPANASAPPRPPHRHRPAPKVPDRMSATKALPDLPSTGNWEPPDAHEEHGMHIDDAYDRYQAFRQKQHDSSSQRLSIISTSSLESAPVPTSPTTTISSMTLQAPPMSATSTTSESRGHGSGFLNSLLGRKTPVPERKAITISAPTISSPIPSDISRENSPAFGTSWSSLVARDVLEGIPNMERKRQEVRLSP